MPRGAFPDEAIISIRPQFAAAILAGHKTVELRRRIPTVGAGKRLWIYATMPVGAVVGTAIVKAIVRGPPTQIWKTWGEQAAISRTRFREYFSGTEEAIALVLADVCSSEKISIAQLRSLRRGFQPPQVMAPLTSGEARHLRQLGKIAA